MKELSTPNFTPEALAALAVTVITNVLILWGLDIGAKRESALVTLINALFVVAFLIHSAVIRNGRARALTNPPKGVVASDGTNKALSA